MLEQAIDHRVDRRAGGGVLAIDIVRRAGDEDSGNGVDHRYAVARVEWANAAELSSGPLGGTTVTLPIPPMFCRARQSLPAKRSTSAMGTSGAPCPPAATSR